MSLTALIGSSDATFKLSQKLVAALAEKFNFTFEDGWTVVSTRTVDNIQKRIKREKRRANPAAQVKHARTAFSFFTQQQRPVEQKAHPEATFGQLSRFVSEAWKKLSPTDMQRFKDMETSDKSRYQTEKAAALESAASTAAEATPVVVAPVAETASPKKARTPKTPKSATPAVVAPVVATPAPVEEKKAKTPKSAKTSTPAVVAPVVAAPVAAAPKSAKGKKAETAAPVEAPVEAPVATPVKAAAAPKATKAKAVKA
jgi:hypothetical protein